MARTSDDRTLQGDDVFCRVRSQQTARTTIVWLDGESCAEDPDDASRMMEELAALPLPEGGQVVLDVSGLDLLSPAGVRMLVALGRRCHEHSATLLILSYQRDEQALLELLDVGTVLPVGNRVTRPVLVSHKYL